MSLDNLDPELRPFLDMYLSTDRSYDAEGLRKYRDGMSAMLGAMPRVRPASVLVEDVTVPGPAGDRGSPPIRSPCRFPCRPGTCRGRTPRRPRYH